MTIKRSYKDIIAASPEILKKVDLNRRREKSHSNLPNDNKILDHSISNEKHSRKLKDNILDRSISNEKSAKNKISEVKKTSANVIIE